MAPTVVRESWASHSTFRFRHNVPARSTLRGPLLAGGLLITSNMAPVPEPGNRPPPSVGSIGDRLGNRYRLLRPLARGGMAEVWEAHDEILDRAVAAKILYPHLAADPGFVVRFRREAIAAARLNHPSIVAVYDTGVDHSDRGQRAYIIMELVPGRTLRAVMSKGDLRIEDAVDIAAQSADALAYAHQQGFVHRDVKPANIMVQPDGRVKVADFGIAKAIQTDPDHEDLTQAGAILGTAKYLSPEQVDGVGVDARSDIYSLGVVLYEMVCGRPPFTGPTDLSTALLHVQGTALRPRQVRAGIPRPLEDVIVTAMARDPAHRFPRVSELARALRAIDLRADDAEPTVAHNRADHTPPRGVLTNDTVLVTRQHTTVVQRPVVGPTRGPRRAIVALLGVIGLLVGGGAGWKAGTPSLGGGAIPIVAVSSFDPLPDGDGRERDDLLSALTDGSSAAWTTETYGSSDLFLAKRGVGVRLDLGSTKTIGSLIIYTPTKGWSAEMYLGETPADTIGGWGQPVARVDDLNVAQFALAGDGRKARYVLLWITNLGPNKRVAITELGIRG